ncbi:MAG: hypothetical protein MI864_11035 [Pseudomonadales bacterium]|nr:hypothetical protein [Pseudomonadales bacterium]
MTPNAAKFLADVDDSFSHLANMPNTTTVPKGGEVNIFTPVGGKIRDSLGHKIDNKELPKDIPFKTFKEGDEIPNIVLAPGDGSLSHLGLDKLNFGKYATTVDKPTPLSELLTPNMGACNLSSCIQGLKSSGDLNTEITAHSHGGFSNESRMLSNNEVKKLGF